MHALEDCPPAMPDTLPGEPQLTTVLGELRTKFPRLCLKPDSTCLRETLLYPQTPSILPSRLCLQPPLACGLSGLGLLL